MSEGTSTLPACASPTPGVARTCVNCGGNLPTESRPTKLYCSLRCKRGRSPLTGEPKPDPVRSASDSPDKTCTRDGCNRPLRARGLCARDWRQEYGKRPTVVVPCAACGIEVDQRVGDSRRRVCSDICRAYLQHGIWPRCDIPKRHAALGYVPPSQRQRLWPAPTQRSCLWCSTEFAAHRMDHVFCATQCKTKAKNARRRARERNASGTYTWAEVVHLFLDFERCCAYCKQEVEGQPEPDHVVPLSRGGSNSITNILPSCSPCNSDKRDLLLHEWALDRERRHLTPRVTEWRRGDPLYAHLSIVLAPHTA
ncbi:HNH endonuclease [Streptosporangium sp. G12]